MRSTILLNRRLFSAVLSAVVALPAIAHAADPAPAKPAAVTYYADDPAKWGTPLAWQAPDYPKAMLEQKVTGKVDVLVNVSAEGRLTDIAAIRSQPAQPVFEEAVREAVRSWTYNKATDANCKPAATQGRVQVRFELVDGAPQVNVGAVSAAKQSGHLRIEELNRGDVNRALMQNYPKDARRMGKMGDVLAMLKVDARTGVTQSVEITDVDADNSSHNPEPKMTPVSTNLRTQPRSSPASIQFAAVAREELAALRFKPVADAGEDVITVCREVAFRMRGVGRKP